MNRIIAKGLLAIPVLAIMFAPFTLHVMTSAAGAADPHHCFYLDDPLGRDQVRFTSDAPIELIEGTTAKIKGKVCYAPHFKFKTAQDFEVFFEVDLASIKTGIPLRDQHMRDEFLHTTKYPKATFKATQVKTNAKPPFNKIQVVTVQSLGQLTLHGKTVDKPVTLKVTYFPESDTTRKRFKSGNIIRIQGTFPVKLADHTISRPEALFVKLADTVFVTVDVSGTDDPSALK